MNSPDVAVRLPPEAGKSAATVLPGVVSKVDDDPKAVPLFALPLDEFPSAKLAFQVKTMGSPSP
jgi:hypothetical protein